MPKAAIRETEKAMSGWTVDTYAAHNEALRHADDKFQAERDRRYTERDELRQLALAIKEEADKTALLLQRATQEYKDEKANLLREQIGGERNLYATKEELIAAIANVVATIKPVTDYVATQQGRAQGIQFTTGTLFASLAAVGTIAFLIARLTGHS